MTTTLPGTHNILNYGAVADGVTLNTVAIQAAIDAAEGGGEVVVPAGTFLIGSLFLKSRVTLRLCQGAVLLGSPRLEDYVPVCWGHHKDRTPWHLINAQGVDHVVITGEGTIDGSGPAFWEPTRPHEDSFWHERVERPSPMVEISNCADVRVEGVTLTNPAGWTLHLHDTDRAIIHGLTIKANPLGPNSDGIDLTGCQFVTISDCQIDCGDDAIALKTTEDSRACEYITVTNCVLATNCVAVRVGFESDQDFRHITVSNCVIPRCSRAIGILTMSGGLIEDVTISNITGTTNCGWPVGRAIEIQHDRIDNLYQGHMPAQHPNCGKHQPVTRPGGIRNITLRDINLVTDGRVLIGGLSDGLVRDIRIDGLRLQYPMIDDPYPIGVRAKNPAFFPALPELRGARAAVVAQHVTDLELTHFSVDWPTYPVPADWKLLTSHNRAINAALYVDHEEAVRAGTLAPPFHAFWGRNLTGGTVDLRRVTGSVADVAAAEVEESTVEVAVSYK